MARAAKAEAAVVAVAPREAAPRLAAPLPQQAVLQLQAEAAALAAILAGSKALGMSQATSYDLKARSTLPSMRTLVTARRSAPGFGIRTQVVVVLGVAAAQVVPRAEVAIRRTLVSNKSLVAPSLMRISRVAIRSTRTMAWSKQPRSTRPSSMKVHSKSVSARRPPS